MFVEELAQAGAVLGCCGFGVKTSIGESDVGESSTSVEETLSVAVLACADNSLFYG